MANYTADMSLPMMVGTTETHVDERMLSRSRSGSVKARLLFSGKKREFQLVHHYLTNAQKTTLDAFYDANRALAFYFTWNSATYTVIFGGPVAWEPQGNGLWNAAVPLLEV